MAGLGGSTGPDFGERSRERDYEQTEMDFLKRRVKDSPAASNRKGYIQPYPQSSFKGGYLKDFQAGHDEVYDDLKRGGEDKYYYAGQVGRHGIGAVGGVINAIVPGSVAENKAEKREKERFAGKSGKPLEKHPASGNVAKRSERKFTRPLGTRVKEDPMKRGPTRKGKKKGKKKKTAVLPVNGRQSYGFLPQQLRAIKTGFRRGGFRGPSRIIRAPVASGGVYTGQTVKFTPITRRGRGGNVNCAGLKTRLFLGQIKKLITTGATSWQPNGTEETGGQWFFMPTNQFYWPTSSVMIAQARMYQFYYLKNVSVEFESSIQPGLTTNYKTYYGWLEDPNLGETFIASYTSVSNLSVTNLMKMPGAKSCPAWKPRCVLRPPKRWYAGKKYAIRTYALDEAIATDAQDATAENKQAIPFGLWVFVDGPTPTATTTICDVFINLHMEFCELAPTQLFDTTGGATFKRDYYERYPIPFLTKSTRKHILSHMSAEQLALYRKTHNIEEKEEEKEIFNDLQSEEDLVHYPTPGEQRLLPLKPKSSSIKSTGTSR